MNCLMIIVRIFRVDWQVLSISSSRNVWFWAVVLAGYGEKLLEPLRRLTTPQTFRSDECNTEIVCASLGNDAGLIGAAML